MYLNADNLPDGTLLQGFDICIVGAGAAGLPMANRLIGSGKRVLLIVSGTVNDRHLPTEQRQSIYRGTVGDFLKRVDPIFLDRSRQNMYGGTTNHFGFWSRPLDDADLRARPGYRDASWPLTSADLAPYYLAAHEYARFGPFNYEDIPFWERALYARCFPTQPGDALHGMIMHGQYDAEIRQLQIQLAPALEAAENITVLFNAHLLRIETTPDRAHVTRLHCATMQDGRAGQHFQVQAEKVVLAMGGIETVRALQLSDNLGNNRRDHLGRGFMVHPLVTRAARVRFARPVDLGVVNFFRDQQVCLEGPQVEGGAYTPISAPLVNPENKDELFVFNAWGVLTPTDATMEAERIGNLRLILVFNETYDEAIVNINWEQVPNEDSRITLNPDVRDPVFGQPVVHLDWRLLDVDKYTMRRGLELCEAYLRARGAMEFTYITDVSGGAEDWSVEPHEGALTTGDHHIGALRMAVSPDDGIVNADARVHTVDNLYIAGCSIFPTSGFANPTLTIIALALRLADHLKG